MPITVEVISSSGRKLTAAQAQRTLKSYGEKLEQIPQRVRKKLPSTFQGTITNKVRNNFKENYINQEGWKRASASERYVRLKNKQLARGDIFKVGSFGGPMKVQLGGNAFGLRTGRLLDFMRDPRGTEVTIQERKAKRSFDLQIRTRLRDELFDNRGDIQTIGGTNKTVSLTARNALHAFAHRIATGSVQPGGDVQGETNILVRMTPQQLNDIRLTIRRNWRVAVRETIQSREFRT